MSKIDRIFCSTDFESLSPLAHARALSTVGSDHTPIVGDSGVSQARFKILKVVYLDQTLRTLSLNRNIIDWWHVKLRLFRKLAKGWSAHLLAEIRKHKKCLMEEYDLLDIKAENLALSDVQRDRLNSI
jgi:endonuclease/exonuclease/phosphatase family metal-dependent hydrolase